MNFVFWTGYTISRLVAIVYSKYFQPRIILAYGLLLINIAMVSLSKIYGWLVLMNDKYNWTFPYPELIAFQVIICIFGQDISLILWICTLLFGLSSAILYPTGESISKDNVGLLLCTPPLATGVMGLCLQVDGRTIMRCCCSRVIVFDFKVNSVAGARGENTSVI